MWTDQIPTAEPLGRVFRVFLEKAQGRSDLRRYRRGKPKREYRKEKTPSL